MPKFQLNKTLIISIILLILVCFIVYRIYNYSEKFISYGRDKMINAKQSKVQVKILGRWDGNDYRTGKARYGRCREGNKVRYDHPNCQRAVKSFEYPRRFTRKHTHQCEPFWNAGSGWRTSDTMWHYWIDADGTRHNKLMKDLHDLCPVACNTCDGKLENVIVYERHTRAGRYVPYDPGPYLCKENLLGKEYRGNVKKTRTGRDCELWSEEKKSDGKAGWHPTWSGAAEKGIGDHRYCRNPDNEPEGPWCYIKGDPNKRWEYCNVDLCNGKDKCKDKNDKDAREYRGNKARNYGHKCMNWSIKTKMAGGDGIYTGSGNAFENGLGDHNYCRNPDHDVKGAWCYSATPGKRLLYCNLPPCE